MQPHKVVSRQEWIEARKAHLAHEKEYTKARCLGSGSTRLTSSAGRTAKQRSPTCSRAAASWWCSISCSGRTGTRADRTKDIFLQI
jgi:hypothetical protein